MFLYTRPSDRVHGTLSVSTGAEDPDYPAENLDGDAPDRPAKLRTPNGAWLRDVGVAQRVDFCALIHHNFQPGLEVRLQGHSSPVWTAPRVDRTFTIPDAFPDNFRVNVWLDLTAVADRTLQFWRLVIPTANAAPPALGEWAMYSTLRTFGIRNIARGSERSWSRPSLVHETDYLVRRVFPFQTVVRSCKVTLAATDATAKDVDAWQRSTYGPGLPFVVVPHKDQDDAWLVAFTDANQALTRSFINVNGLTLTMRELSRGLPL